MRGLPCPRVPNGEARPCDPRSSVWHLVSGFPLEMPFRVPGCSLSSSAKRVALPLSRGIAFYSIIDNLYGFIHLFYNYFSLATANMCQVLCWVLGTSWGQIKNSFCLDEASSPTKAMDIDQSHNKCWNKSVMCVSKRKSTGCPKSGLQGSLSRGDPEAQIERGS